MKLSIRWNSVRSPALGDTLPRHWLTRDYHQLPQVAIWRGMVSHHRAYLTFQLASKPVCQQRSAYLQHQPSSCWLLSHWNSCSTMRRLCAGIGNSNTTLLYIFISWTLALSTILYYSTFALLMLFVLPISSDKYYSRNSHSMELYVRRGRSTATISTTEVL